MTTTLTTTLTMPDPLPIASAPRDGSTVYVVRDDDGRLFEATWNPEGDSWVDGDLAVTGSWFCTVGGWFQPDEVKHWYSADMVKASTLLQARVDHPAGERRPRPVRGSAIDDLDDL